ncbi:uncharacterized protein LOC127803287 isoform X2 [Diospyros lotus]|uniref:uncharacterized protein LOC127803287 isoform X2 n=1 Tax=Diospyros lotus TaxID=55363 RepID=UPI002252E82D|nr:uncharacterized protein LOC127803287 isoform X2 [Diospyros lotus]
MANCESWVSSSSGEQFRLVDLKLPRLNDEEIKIQVEQTHAKHYSLVLRQPLLVSISHILEPVTNFVDSILLDNKVSKNETELETNNLLELNSTFSDLNALVGGRCFSAHTLLLDRARRIVGSEASILQEFSTISELKTLARHDYFMIPTLMMEKTANNAVQMSDEINVHMASMDLLKFLSNLSWDAKAVNTMGCFVFKFLEFLGFLLHGTNQPITDLASSMAALKENHISLVGSPLEKFQVPLDQLNNLIKLILEVIEYISKFTLLADTEYNKEDLLSMSAHWAILSVVVCYVQITLLMHNGKVALEASHLISNLSHILNGLKHHYTICKPLIGVWYIKGRPSFFKGKESCVIIDLQHGNQYQDLCRDCFGYYLELVEAEHFPFKRLSIKGCYRFFFSGRSTLPYLYPERHEEDVNQAKPPSGFQGLLNKCTRGSLNLKQAKHNSADVTSKGPTTSLISSNAKQTKPPKFK